MVAEKAFTQLRRGTLEFCVLALLQGEERYGFDLVKELGEIDGMVTTEGTIYPLLARLRREGLVETSWRESESGPPRRYYRATAEGGQALADFTADWERFRTSVDDILRRGNEGKKK
ncbi:PadR family transcriptional regulator [Kribbella sp. NPDC058245]|uniref:PadR family transcriptional regulator n=1 Tax=Kribbella sp. NPDC058245 TaxID=3346399 RepID=UPI0036ED996F